MRTFLRASAMFRAFGDPTGNYVRGILDWHTIPEILSRRANFPPTKQTRFSQYQALGSTMGTFQTSKIPKSQLIRLDCREDYRVLQVQGWWRRDMQRTESYIFVASTRSLHLWKVHLGAWSEMSPQIGNSAVYMDETRYTFMNVEKNSNLQYACRRTTCNERNFGTLYKF